jgi:regulatory protein
LEAQTIKVIDKSEQANDQAKIWSTALRILTRRDYSQKELCQRLLDKGFDLESIHAVLQRCQKLGYLDDNRYALNRAASLLSQGRAVGVRVLADLRQRGIGEETARRALEKALEGYDENQLLKSLMKRRFPNFNYEAAPSKERRRIVYFLQRRGFPLSCIMDLLTQKGFAKHDEDR